MKRKSICIAFLLLTGLALSAQIIPIPPYPKGYFQWPLHLTPGIAANFGELRPNHYHMGLDVRTDHKQNQQVFAAAEGYIAHVKIEPSGFGRSIYINHPNGLTTVYAHLNEFNPELEKYVTQKQYEQKSWKVYLDIPPDSFPVKKDQFIAYSGNTGASQGPHLHFEIRDTKTDKVLNPLLFGLPIVDNIPPDLYKLAVYDRDISVFDQTPRTYALKKVNGVYIVPALIRSNSDKVSFAINAYDRYENAGGRNGIFQAVLFDSSKPIVGFQLNSISYDETRDFNAHIDYKLRSNGGGWLEHVSRLPGYIVSPYHSINGDGIVDVSDDSIHKMHMEISDPFGNISLLQFSILRDHTAPKKVAAICPDCKKFIPNQENKFESDNFIMELPSNCIYDTIYCHLTQANKTYQLIPNYIPEHKYFTVRIKEDIPADLQSKVVMMCASRGTPSYEKTSFDNGWYSAEFREFGTYQLMVDNTPPFVTPIGFRDNIKAVRLKRITFAAGDNTGWVKSFNVTIDGNWIRFTNDKGRLFSYIFDEHCPPGEHEMKVTVEDLVGNVTEKVYHFVR